MPDWRTLWPPTSFEPLKTIALGVAVVVVSLLLGLIAVAVIAAHHLLALPEFARFAHAGTPPNAAAFRSAVEEFRRAHPQLFLRLVQPTVPEALGSQAILDLSGAALLLLFLPRIAAVDLRALGFARPDARAILVALAGIPIAFLTVFVAEAILTLSKATVRPEEVIRLLAGVRDPATITAFVLFAVVLAPFAEEIFFRVFLFNAIARHAGFWAGALVSSAVFALAHADLSAFLPLAGVGIVLCWVYARTRNAWCAMLTHGGFNGAMMLGFFSLHH